MSNGKLLLPSVVRLHKLATLEKRLVVRRLGTVTTTRLDTDAGNDTTTLDFHLGYPVVYKV